MACATECNPFVIGTRVFRVRLGTPQKWGREGWTRGPELSAWPQGIYLSHIQARQAGRGHVYVHIVSSLAGNCTASALVSRVSIDTC